MKTTSRKIVISLAMVLVLLLTACSGNNSSSNTSTGSTAPDPTKKDLVEIKLGYQKGMPLLSLLKEKSNLAERLEAEGFKISWNEFAATPAMLEAMVDGGIVFGGGGATGSIYAQQAGRSFVRIGAQTGVSGGSSIIVRGDSGIQSVKDLKGKKVVVSKGTTQHYMLVRALEKEGLSVNDIQLQFIQPAEAFSAFGSKNFDAWAIWDPFTAEAEASFDARVIADNTSVFGDKAPLEGENLYYAERKFANEHPHAIKIILDELGIVGKWANENTDEAAKILANLYSSNVDILKVVEERGGTREILPMSEVTIEPLQNISDFFYEQGVIPEKLNASDENFNWVLK